VNDWTRFRINCDTISSLGDPRSGIVTEFVRELMVGELCRARPRENAWIREVESPRSFVAVI
jgi:hypothetical protein